MENLTPGRSPKSTSPSEARITRPDVVTTTSTSPIRAGAGLPQRLSRAVGPRLLGLVPELLPVSRVQRSQRLDVDEQRATHESRRRAVAPLVRGLLDESAPAAGAVEVVGSDHAVPEDGEHVRAVADGRGGGEAVVLVGLGLSPLRTVLPERGFRDGIRLLPQDLPRRLLHRDQRVRLGAQEDAVLDDDG